MSHHDQTSPPLGGFMFPPTSEPQNPEDPPRDSPLTEGDLASPPKVPPAGLKGSPINIRTSPRTSFGQLPVIDGPQIPLAGYTPDPSAPTTPRSMASRALMQSPASSLCSRRRQPEPPKSFWEEVDPQVRGHLKLFALLFFFAVVFFPTMAITFRTSDLPLEESEYAPVDWDAEGLKAWCSARLDFVKNDAKNINAVLLLVGEYLRLLDNVQSLSELMASVHPDSSVREVADECMMKASAQQTSLFLDKGLYEKVVSSPVDGMGRDGQETARFRDYLLKRFRRGGVHLNTTLRSRLKELTDEIEALGQSFESTLASDRRVLTYPAGSNALEGLSDEFLRPRTREGVVELSTDYPDYLPAMRDAANATLRKNLWTMYTMRGSPRNIATLERLLLLRAEYATILGYNTWADYAVEDKMIKTVKKVVSFLRVAFNEVRSRGEKEAQQLAEWKNNDIKAGKYAACCACKCCECPTTSVIHAWDYAFYSAKVQAELYSFNESTLSPYATLQQVQSSLFAFVGQNFGVTFRKLNIKAWHADVAAYEVLETKDKALIGRMYLDLLPREGKYKHAAQFTLRTGVEGVQVSEACLVTNFPRHGQMATSQIFTFVHEFGHLLHHLFSGKSPWVVFGGTGSVQDDFVEAPSQFLENFVYDVMRGIKDEQNNTVSEGTLERLANSRLFGRGIEVRQQIFYAMVSLCLHLLQLHGELDVSECPEWYSQDLKQMSSTSLVSQLQNTYSVFPYVPQTSFQGMFGHLVGYSSNYYTYQWSLSIAQDFAQTYKNERKKGIGSDTILQRYRDVVLVPGGRVDTKDLIGPFTGHYPQDYAPYMAYLSKLPVPSTQ